MREKQNFIFGCVCIALATLIFSTMEVVLKLPAVEGAFHPMQITLGRFLVGGICLLPVAGWALYRKKTKLTGKDLRSFALTGFFCVPLAMVLYQLALYSINLRIMDDKANQAINPDNYDLLVSLRDVRQLAADNPILVGLLFTAAIVALLYWFFGTELGSGIRATGANPNMSRAQGINVGRNKVLGLMLSNGIVALSSALYAQYQGFADVNAGRGAIVIGLAAVIIGDVLFARIFHNFALKLVAVAIGAVIYYVVLQIVLTLGLNSNDLKLFSALVVAVFLAVPYWKGKAFRGRAKAIPAGKEGAPHA